MSASDSAPSTPTPLARLLLAVISLYRATAGMRVPRCRFVPTCSSYAQEAIATYGAWRGSWLATKRIARCHPWGAGGLDPVPATRRDPVRS